MLRSVLPRSARGSPLKSRGFGVGQRRIPYPPPFNQASVSRAQAFRSSSLSTTPPGLATINTARQDEGVTLLAGARCLLDVRWQRRASGQQQSCDEPPLHAIAPRRVISRCDVGAHSRHACDGLSNRHAASRRMSLVSMYSERARVDLDHRRVRPPRCAERGAAATVIALGQVPQSLSPPTQGGPGLQATGETRGGCYAFTAGFGGHALWYQTLPSFTWLPLRRIRSLHFGHVPILATSFLDDRRVL